MQHHAIMYPVPTQVALPLPSPPPPPLVNTKKEIIYSKSTIVGIVVLVRTLGKQWFRGDMP
jgi:hypothetical protein